MPTDLQSVSFYGILDTAYVSRDQWIRKYDELVNGGAGIVQIRAKCETTEQRAELLDLIVTHRAKETSKSQPYLVVNDDIELCLSYPNIGLHVGQDDLDASEARKKLGPNRILGLSTHSPEQAQSAISLPSGVLDYFAVGPVFATQTKPDYKPVGLQLVSFVAAQKPTLPFFCIGGINRQNIPQVREAGGNRIVTVSDVLCDNDTTAAVRQSLLILAD